MKRLLLAMCLAMVLPSLAAALLRTIFIENTGHHQVEHRPGIIDEITWISVNGEPLADFVPD